MKKILYLLLFFLPVLGVAQSRYGVEGVPMCWTTALGVDSSIIRYVLVSTTGQPVKTIVHENASGVVVNVSGGTLRYGFCDCAGALDSLENGSVTWAKLATAVKDSINKSVTWARLANPVKDSIRIGMNQKRDTSITFFGNYNLGAAIPTDVIARRYNKIELSGDGPGSIVTVTLPDADPSILNLEVVVVTSSDTIQVQASVGDQIRSQFRKVHPVKVNEYRCLQVGAGIVWKGSVWDSLGVGGQTSIQFKDEGSNLGSQGTVTALDFTGSGVAASRSGNTIVVNVTGGGGITTQTLGDTAKNGRIALRDYSTGNNKLTGLIGINSADYNQEYDFIPNLYSYTNTPVLNYLRPEWGYGSRVGTLSGATISYNTVDNEFSQKLADRITAAASSNGKVFLQLNRTTYYPTLPDGAYTLTWKMRTESGTYNVKHGTLDSETITSLGTAWTTFSFNFTYTGATQYIVLCMETGGNAVDVRMGDLFLLRQSPIYPPVGRKTDAHAYTVAPVDFLYNSKLLYNPEFTITCADSVLFDTVCITAIVRPTWASVPSYGAIFSDRIAFSTFWFGTQTDSSFNLIMASGAGANSPVLVKTLNNYLGKGLGYIIVIQKIGGTIKGYLNGLLIWQTGVAASVWKKQFLIGALNNSSGLTIQGLMEGFGVYRGVCDPVLLTKQLMSSSVIGKEVRTDKCVLSEGDSISESNGAPKKSNQKTKFPLCNLALSGTGVTQMTTTRKATMKAAIADAVKLYKTVVVTIHMGANDIAAYTGSAYYAATMPYVAELRALGAKVAICTILPRSSNPTFNTNRAAYNTLLRAGVGNDFDALIDYDTTIMGLEATTTNTTYYLDGLHPTDVGQQILEPVYTAVVRSL